MAKQNLAYQHNSIPQSYIFVWKAISLFHIARFFLFVFSPSQSFGTHSTVTVPISRANYLLKPMQPATPNSNLLLVFCYN